MSWRGGMAVAVFMFAASYPAAADEASGGSPDEQAIIATSKEYVAALERGDGKALAEFWMPQGDVIDDTGRLFSAQELIGEEAKAAKDAPRPQVKLTIRSIRFLTSDVALEDGASEVTAPASKAPPRAAGSARSGSRAKENGGWRACARRASRRRAAPRPLPSSMG